MYRKVNIVLLVLAAFIVLGFSVTANAGNPWLADKEQTIASAPLMSVGYRCSFVNMTDTVVVGEAYIVNNMNEYLHHTMPSSFSSDPGRTYYLSGINAPAENRRCVITWVGQPDDIRASFCTAQDGTDWQLEGFGVTCLELR